MKLFLILLLPIALFSQEQLTLQKAIEKALENNYQIKISRKQLEIAENNNFIGRAGILPTLDAGGNFGQQTQSGQTELPGGDADNIIIAQDNATRTQLGANITLNWTLFDGFAMFSNMKRLDLLEDDAQIRLQLSIEANLRDVINNYLGVLNSQVALENLSKSLELSRKRLNLAKDKFEYGNVSGSAVLSAEVDLNSDSSAYLSAEIELENFKRAFIYSIGEDFDYQFNLSNELNFEILPSLSSLQESVFEKNSSINLAINQGRISKEDRRLILSEYYPRVNFTAGYDYSSVANNQGFPVFAESYGPSYGLNAQINLFNGLNTKTDLENNSINLEMREIEIQDIKATILLNLKNLYDTYKRQKSLLELEKLNLSTAESNLERAESSFEYGTISSVEFREAQLNLIRAKNRIISAEVSLKRTEAELLLLKGDFPE